MQPVAAQVMSFVACVCVSARVFGPIRVPYSYRSLGNLVVSSLGKCLALTVSADPHGRNKAITRWVFQPLPRPVGFTWELEPNSTQGVCGSRSSPPTLPSAVSRSFHRTLFCYSQPPNRISISVQPGFFLGGGAQPINKHFPPMVLHFDL